MTKTFIELLEAEEEDLQTLEEQSEEMDCFCLLALDEQELNELSEECGIDMEELVEIVESIQRRVSSTGEITKMASRNIRQRRATATTGLSKSELKRRARRAALTRKRNPALVKKAVRKRRKAMKRRVQLGIKN